jgi:hypothetical protein
VAHQVRISSRGRFQTSGKLGAETQDTSRYPTCDAGAFS